MQGMALALCERGVEQWPEISSHAASHGLQLRGFAQRRVLQGEGGALLYLRRVQLPSIMSIVLTTSLFFKSGLANHSIASPTGTQARTTQIVEE